MGDASCDGSIDDCHLNLLQQRWVVVSYCNHDSILTFEGTDERSLGRVVDLNDLDAGGECAAGGISSTDSNVELLGSNQRVKDRWSQSASCLINDDRLVDISANSREYILRLE